MLILAAVPRVTSPAGVQCSAEFSAPRLPVFSTRPLSRVHRTSKLSAQDGWVTDVDEASGATYYFNHLTGESQWAPPQAAQQSSGAQIFWRLAASSGVAESTTMTGIDYQNWGLEAVATKPYTLAGGDEQVLGRYNMLQQKLTVSRRQCTVRCLYDGTATLSSWGRGPTMWRERGGPWCTVGVLDSLVLTDGDQVGLDVNDPDGAVFTCHKVGGRQDGFAQDSYALQDAQQQLPYPWEQLMDRDGGVYYSNPHTGSSSWAPPS